MTEKAKKANTSLDNPKKTISPKRKKQLKGGVVSDKGDKTVIVEVQRIKKHRLYRKRYRVHKKYKAHDQKNNYKTEDKVIIQECRPISRDKRWRVISKIQ